MREHETAAIAVPGTSLQTMLILSGKVRVIVAAKQKRHVTQGLRQRLTLICERVR